MTNDTRPATKTPNGIFTFEDFMALPLERPKPAIEGFLFEGQTAMLAGRFAVGKTLLATQMAVHLAAGKDFLGRAVHHPYKVAFVDCENGPSEIQTRWQQQLRVADLSTEELARVNVNCLYANARDVGTALYGLQLEKDRTKPFETFLNDCGPEIVIIDNLGRVIAGDLEETKDVTGFFSTVQGVKERCPSVKLLLFLHHIKKPSDHREKCTLFDSPYEYLTQMRGSGRLLDFSESRFALAEETFNGASFFVLNGLARSAQVAPIVLERDEKSLSFQLVADKRFLLDSLFSSRPKGKELMQAMQKAQLREFKFGDTAKLTDDEGKPFNRGTISSTLQLALANGLLTHGPDATYTLPETLY